MAHYYALTARHEGSVERTCALIPSASLHGAARAARALRESGTLGFVDHPARFRLRSATRTETSLMHRFLASCQLESPADRIGADFDGLVARRQRLLLSFFLALYIDPRGLKARLRDVVDPGWPAGGPGGSGGVERPALQVAAQEQAVTQEADVGRTSRDPLLPQDSAGGAPDGPVGADSQEAALAAILSSNEANDGGAGRDASYDLDDLF